MSHLLLVYYHPIILDLAETFSRIFKKVTITAGPNLKDNYGGFEDLKNKIKSKKALENIDFIPLAVAQIKIKSFDLVGLDGVFDGDDTIMGLCKNKGVPYFCINGYPHQLDEPSDNILAFSHFLPQQQYRKNFPHEGYVKEVDWKEIAEKGCSSGKNILVFYPELNDAKRYYNSNFKINYNQDFVSFIHRYEECNKWTFKVYQNLKNEFPTLENYSNKTQDEVFRLMDESRGLLHLKHADCPGISVLEALVFGVPVCTIRSFVEASQNQEVLIDNFNAIIAEDVNELIERMKTLTRTSFLENRDYIWNLTSFNRQKNKLERFFEQCMKK